MIQRKQSLFLLLAVVLGVVALSMPLAMVTSDGMVTARIYNLLYTDSQGGAHFVVWPLFALLVFASALSLYAIFLFKRRLLQARLCLVSIIALLAWYVGLIAYSKMLAPDAANFHLSLTAALPAVSLILNFMARKAILADEKLVRAADRIR